MKFFSIFHRFRVIACPSYAGHPVYIHIYLYMCAWPSRERVSVRATRANKNNRRLANWISGWGSPSLCLSFSLCGLGLRLLNDVLSTSSEQPSRVSLRRIRYLPLLSREIRGRGELYAIDTLHRPPDAAKPFLTRGDNPMGIQLDASSYGHYGYVYVHKSVDCCNEA